MKNNKIKNIFIDLDNTILDFAMQEEVSLKKTFCKINLPFTKENIDEYYKINYKMWRLLEQNLIKREDIFENRFLLFFKEINFDFDPIEAERIYEHFLGEGHFLVHNSLKLIKEIYLDYDLYIATNGIKHIQDRRIDSSKIRKYFKKIFISDEIGFSKPDKRFFEACFKQIKNFKNEETIIVGDSLTSDIQGGINSNIKTVWLNKNNMKNDTTIKPDFEIRNIYELKDILHILNTN
ncbi:MAG: YjjG family noncanonical pyrimidine nucleotidase [Eubacteriales bacterium]|nr:YjjG family noncanonical pyrimidine nucleotidase [Eubacteriales bacterium]